MSHSKGGRPEWFKFWRRNRAQLDIEQLSIESRGKVFTNMMRYFDQDAELLEMDALEMLAFNVLKVNVDDSIAEYAETSRKNRENVNKRWHSSESEYDRIRPYTMATKIEDRRQKSEERRENSAENPPHTPKKRYGAYGWVQLTEEQYARLLQDLGPAELERCIQYIDESAQQTGNKNKWKDWNLVIRKCSRERWGIKQTASEANWKEGCVVGWNGTE